MSEAVLPRPYIPADAYNLLFIIGAPIIAFSAVTMVSLPRAVTGEFLIDPETPDWFIAMSALLTHTHVMLVFVRSHLNKKVFRRFPLRFTVVPVVMLVAFTVSPFLAGVLSFLALYWDEWHSLMQTFGFGRIYDVGLGNDPRAGRKLDMGMCFVLGLLPHMLLLTYLPEKVRSQGLQNFLDLSPDIANQYGHHIHALQYPLIFFGVGYTFFYLWSYRKLVRNGYKISTAKLGLFLTTGITAILIASFYSVTDAAYFGNIYHALQYFFIVSVSEAPVLSGRIHFPKLSRKALTILCGLIALTVAFAAAVARLTPGRFTFLGDFWLLTSLLHFWYDGFIWSVRKP
jgi:hypothetical protein